MLGADTIVVHQDCILEKPKDRQEAKAMLSCLSNASHEVMTAVVVAFPLLQPIEPSQLETDGILVIPLDTLNVGIQARVETTRVDMSSISEQDLEGYLDTDEWR
jgi:predicted house-cleaning NTP pyrophosphatase (Maf/HAM1 superfamily)